MMDMQAELNRLQYENFLLQDQLRCANRKTSAALREADKLKKEITDMRQEGREWLIDHLQQQLDLVRGMMNASTRDNRKLLADVNWAYGQLRDRPIVTITKAPAYHVHGPVLGKQGRYSFKYRPDDKEVVAEVWVRPWERMRPYPKGRNRKRDLRDKLALREALDPLTDTTMDAIYEEIAWSDFWSDDDAWEGASDYDEPYDMVNDDLDDDWWYDDEPPTLPHWEEDELFLAQSEYRQYHREVVGQPTESYRELLQANHTRLQDLLRHPPQENEDKRADVKPHENRPTDD